MLKKNKRYNAETQSTQRGSEHGASKESGAKPGCGDVAEQREAYTFGWSDAARNFSVWIASGGAGKAAAGARNDSGDSRTCGRAPEDGNGGHVQGGDTGYARGRECRYDVGRAGRAATLRRRTARTRND